MYFVDFFLKVDDNGLNRFILKILKLNTTRRNKMKRTTKKIMAGTVALSCLTLGAGGLHAQVAQVLTIKASASVQGAYSQSYNSHTYVTTYTTAAPVKHSVATKDLLALLAADYKTNFPSGTKLMSNNNGIQVVDKSNNLLQDVSGVMSISNPGTNDITSGKSTSLNPGLGTSANEQLLTISFDDTGIGGSLKFFLTGIGTGKTTDTTPNKTTGAYTETDTGSLSSGTGEGSYQGNPFVCTGTASASGKATLNINQPSISANGGSDGVGVTQIFLSPGG
jgi:hypothetical protein